MSSPTTAQESLKEFAIFQAAWLLRRAQAMVDSGPDEGRAITDAFKAVAHLVDLKAVETRATAILDRTAARADRLATAIATEAWNKADGR